MKSPSLISILLPIYNAEKYIKKALNSIQNQTYKNIEIICIDDGSIDNSLNILKELALKDSRVKVYVNKNNLGLIKTLNKAIDLAKGEYFARMDADDISLPNRLEKQFNFLKENDLDLVDCQISFVNENEDNLYRTMFIPKTTKGLKFFSFFKTPLLHPTILCKSSVLKENKYFFDKTTIHCEDYELWTRLLQKKIKLKKYSKKLYIQTINPNSVSNKYEYIQKENFKNLSYSYVSKQFEFKIDKTIWKYCINRFDDITNNEYIKCISILNQIKKEYLANNNFNISEKNEINTIINQQIIDIQIQAIKKTKSVISIFNLFFSKHFYSEFKYFLNKF